MEDYRYQTERYIRFADVDAAGWLYYPRFFELCHNAFEDWINAKAPVNYPQAIDVQHFGFPAIQATGNYRSPLKHGDTALLQLKVEHVGNSSVKTIFEIFHKKDKVLSFEAEIVTVCVDLKAGKSMPIPKDMRQFLLS